MTPAQRSMRARLGGQSRWARTADPVAATAPARRGFMKRFEDEVDPDGALSIEERARRAKHAMSAYMARLSLKSSQARATRGATS